MIDTATLARPSHRPTDHVVKPFAWHRPPLVLAAAMVLLALVTIVGMLVDDRQVTGVDVWLKPFKFAVSVAIYLVTLSWLVGLLVRGRRLARIASNVASVALAIEIVIITAFAATAETSHFNVSTPLHTAAWAIMAASIVIVWGMTLVIAIMLFRTPLGDRARTLAIRAGVVVALIGMGLAFLMTGPNADQLSNYQGIAGAHAVGIPDGGPGLPLLGWSTVAGDLRIPHFLGMHTLQAMLLLAIGLELLARRVPLLRDGMLRFRLVAIAACSAVAVVAIVTVQALSGESIVRPSAPILSATVAVALVAIAAVALSIRAARVRGRLPARQHRGDQQHRDRESGGEVEPQEAAPPSGPMRNGRLS